MGNILQELAEKYNLATDKNQAWGIVGGYWFQVGTDAKNSGMMKIRAAVNLLDEAAVDSVVNGLVRMTRLNRGSNYARNGGAIVISLKKPSGKSAVEKIDAMLLELIALFRQAGAAPACYKCGAPEPDSFSSVNGAALKLCAKCQTDLKDAFEKQAEMVVASAKIQQKAYFGAVSGALIGSIAWVGLGLIGWMSSICGCVISGLAILGFRILKGRITYVSFCFIFLICILAMVLAQFAVTDIDFYRYLSNQSVHISYLRVVLDTFLIPFKYYRSDQFLSYLGIGCLFILLGFLSMIRGIRIQDKVKAGEIKRL